MNLEDLVRIVLELLKKSFLLFCLSGCATYHHNVREAHKALVSGQFERAVELLQPLSHRSGNDQLIYLLDYATALQMSGRYEESAEAFARAENLVDLQDYHSLSRIGASLVLSEEMKQYKGEAHEQVLINGLNALNYLAMKDWEGAMVEVRRMNNKLQYLRREQSSEYSESVFAHYLSGLLYEMMGEYDNAYISYYAAYQLQPHSEQILYDLWRLSQTVRSEQTQKWRNKMTSIPEAAISQIRKGWGELVVIYIQGWGPKKVPRPENFRFPKFVPRFSRTHYAEIRVEPYSIVSKELDSITALAINTLEESYQRLVLSRLAGLGAKAAVATSVSNKDPALAELIWIALNLSDRADVRHWSTLPNSVHIARLPLPPGEHTVEILGLSTNHELTDEGMTKTLKINAGRKTIISWRSIL